MLFWPAPTPKDPVMRRLWLVPLLLAAIPARAFGPEVEELLVLDRKLAPERCEKQRDALELLIASGAGNAARAAEIEKRMKAPRNAEREALAKRHNALLSGRSFSEAERNALVQSRTREDAFCPWGKEDVPPQIPPAKSHAEAREYALVFTPRLLANWRQCEIFFPERKGQLEAAWKASVLSRLDLPELQRSADSVRAWLKDGVGPIPPDSKLGRDLRDPQKSKGQTDFCNRLPADLKRIEAALPADFVAKTRKR